MMARLRPSLQRATSAVALAARNPRDGWLAARMLLWRAALPVLKRLVPLPRLVRLMEARPDQRPRSRDREPQIASLAARAFGRGSESSDCLERSLVTYRYLARAGAFPTLVIAIRKEGSSPRGHAWVTVDGVPVHDSPSRLDGFTSLVSFEAGSRKRPTRPAHHAAG